MKTGYFLSLLICAGLLASQNPDPREYLASAQQAEHSGDLAAAQKFYEQYLKTKPTAEIYQRLGLVLHLQNKFAGAAKAFESALRMDHSLWGAHLFLGMDEYRTNRFQEALLHLTSAEQLHPGQPETTFWLGATHLALQEYWAGYELLEQVLAKDPNNPDALSLLAESYAERGTQMQNEIAEKYPDSVAGLQVQGRALEFEGSLDAALDSYRKAESKDPTNNGVREAIARLTQH